MNMMRKSLAICCILLSLIVSGCSGNNQSSTENKEGKGTEKNIQTITEKAEKTIETQVETEDTITTESSSSSNDTSLTEKTQITGFKDYDWGTDFKTIKEKEITSEMDEYDYTISDQEGITRIKINDRGVAGYNASESFYFLDDKLGGGVYSIRLWYWDGLPTEGGELINPDDKEIQAANTDILNKYTDVYGEPIKITYDGDELDTALWKDNENNFILIVFNGDSIYIYYGQPNEKYVDLASEFLKYDLIQELNKPDNHSGI